MLKCKQCNKELSFREFTNGNYKKVLDVDLEKIGLFCKEHGEEVEFNLKEKRFVEEYKGNKIYSKDNKFIPYWECDYYFKSIDDVKERIDSSHIAIVDTRMFGLMNK
ncbi:hypothetical protein LCM23_12865 [Cytobacillus kochii]|uniref:hypothetical protein n=1 Tax=Cytobacillus kochii TaxID=859143 RepID=UPI001CD579F3|nr:hypothetical protein [Cytobacillus kochii]MCA1026985.1 hypothetical protein [Cytobacillus kochii]